LSGAQTLAILGYSMISCLVINDALKVKMLRWCAQGAAGELRK
jgi:hypothetical protein